jgi:H+/gluconate symporter-like permease
VRVADAALWCDWSQWTEAGRAAHGGGGAILQLSGARPVVAALLQEHATGSRLLTFRLAANLEGAAPASSVAEVATALGMVLLDSLPQPLRSVPRLSVLAV